MKITMRKLLAVTEAKFKEMFKNKTVMTLPIMALAMTVGMRLLYSNMVEGELPGELLGMVLNLGLTMSVGTMGLSATSTSLALEKEKNTLRTLMTSSINGAEFFLGSIIPPFVMTMAVNIAILFASGVTVTLNHFVIFVVVTVIASITSCVLGMVIGIFAKDQAASATLGTPFILILQMVPIIGSIAPAVGRYSHFVYTGVVGKLAESLGKGEVFKLGLTNSLVLMSQIILAFVLFGYFFKKNGYETD